MPFPRATSSRKPTVIGAVRLAVVGNAAGEPAIGRVDVQILDSSGAEYERKDAPIAVLGAATLAKLEDAISAVRTQAQAEILAP